MDFFANKGNQESVLEEISVFGDAELKAAFVRLFNPPAAADPYLTGSAAITESEIAQMQAAPDNDRQKEIVRCSSGEAVRCLIARFRLSLAGERALLRRKDNNLLEFYFSRYALYEDAQVSLVRTAAKEQERYEILLAYIVRHQLCAEALAEAVRRRLQTIVEAYLKRYPLDSSVLSSLRLGSSTAEPREKIDFLLPLLRRAQDKLMLALEIRKHFLQGKLKEYAFCSDVSTLLRELPANAAVEIDVRLTPMEECALINSGNRQMLMLYVCSLSEEGERALIERNDKEMFSWYVGRRILSGAGLRYLISKGREELFKTYVRRRGFNRRRCLNPVMRAFLHCYGSSQMTEFYRSLGCFWPY